jgi:hypothetical protein
MLFSSLHTQASEVENGEEFGYGFNVAAWDIGLLQSMGFNWMKVFNGPGSRLPVNILLRVDANAGHLGNLSAFGDFVGQLAQEQKGFVDAYEIGNEPNLDASYGWTISPNAADYATLLCQAYTNIKAVDPNAIIVSAGLAPTGRVQGNWNGHPGHNSLFQDEREFFKEFIAAGGGNCLDSVGYHPYGFSADYDAEPDIPSGDSTQNCANGFCFRGVEKIYELMLANGLGEKTLWATEYGWLVEPPQHCLQEEGWDRRKWQIVPDEKQAANLVGSFEYARANWSWMEAMFVFNLNFNTTGGYPTCEQMKYYGVQGRPAESALRDMPKVVEPLQGELAYSPIAASAMITPNQQPFSWTIPINLQNIGTLPFTYTVMAEPGTLNPAFTSISGVLSPTMQTQTQITVTSASRTLGTYTATVTISASAGALGAPASMPITLYVVDKIHQAHLPVIARK